MALHVWGISFARRYQRMVSVTTCAIYIASCIPVEGVCRDKSQTLVNEILIHINIENSEDLLGDFNALKESKESFAEGKKFLNTFLKEIHSRYGLKLTIFEACELIRKNLSTLDLSIDMQKVVLNAIELYESNNPTHLQHQKLENSAMIAVGISWPWQWNWFKVSTKNYGYLFKQQRKKNRYNAHSLFPVCEVEELPSNMYVGAVELLAGALCLIVGTVIPPFQGAAYFLFADGVRRIADGTMQLGEERRNCPDDIPPGSSEESCGNAYKYESFYLQVHPKNN